MEKVMRYSKLFITGYDKNTNWMFDWFMDNFSQHTDIPILPYDFDEFKTPIDGVKNWFKKPFAMIDAAKQAESVCWIDLDCHIQGPIDDIFNHLEPNKLAMVEDVPWSSRRGETWHNSGVVAFSGRPIILDEWASRVALNPSVGDQEVLHGIVREGMKRLIHITDLPRKYNTLRLDLLDKSAPKDISIMHWTRPKGKEKIRSIMNE